MKGLVESVKGNSIMSHWGRQLKDFVKKKCKGILTISYGHLYPNSNLEVANKLTGVLTYTPASHSIADYTSNQHTAAYHKEVK